MPEQGCLPFRVTLVDSSIVTVKAVSVEQEITPSRFCRGFLAYRQQLISSDPQGWLHQRSALEWFVDQDTMTDDQFEEILAEGANHAEHESVRAICIALRDQWRREDRRRYWAARG